MLSERLLEAERGRDERSYTRQKVGCLWQGHLPLGDRRSLGAEDLPGADQEVPEGPGRGRIRA